MDSVVYSKETGDRVTVCWSCGNVERARALLHWDADQAAAGVSPSCPKCKSTAVGWKYDQADTRRQELEHLISGVHQFVPPLLSALKDIVSAVLGRAADSSPPIDGLDNIESALVEEAIKVRSLAKRSGDEVMFAEIESRLRDIGVELIDTPEGTTWKAIDPEKDPDKAPDSAGKTGDSGDTEPDQKGDS